MNTSPLLKALRDLRTSPLVGGDVSRVFLEKNWDELSTRLHLSQPPTSAQMVHRVDYLWHVVRHSIGLSLRPIVFGVSAMVLLLGGWSATVNASVGTLPGDTFYSLKLVSERVQVRLARAEVRPKLHAEFASRRLQEISELSVSGRVDTKDQLRAAIASFKEEMNLAQASLKEVQSTEPEEVAAIALVLDQKNQEFTSFIERSSETITGEVGAEAIQDVKDVVATNTQEVHETLVETHEQHASTSTTQTLEQTFQNSYRETQARSARIVQRIDVLVALDPTRLSNGSVSLSPQVGEWRQVLLLVRSQQDEAAKLFGIGGFRRAFELIHEAETTLGELEQSIAAIEILLTAPTESVKDVTEETPETSSSTGETAIQSILSTEVESSVILEPLSVPEIVPVESLNE